MKRFFLGMTLLLSMCLCLSVRSVDTPEVEKARQHGARGKVTLRVVNSTGKPVEKARLSVAFWSSDSSADVVVSEGQTETNGLYLAEGRTAGEVTFTITKEGFYKTRCTYLFYRANSLDTNESTAIRSTSSEYLLYHQDENRVKNGRWQPWNPTVTVVLKERRNPVAMYVKEVDTRVPLLGQTVGFDLEKGDWVAPYGQGTTPDLIIKYTATYEDLLTFSKRLEVSFSNPQDGIQSFPLDRSSEFMTMYTAPENGYESTIIDETARTRTKILTKSKFAGGHYFVFRVRSVTDERGKIISSNYGKIYGNNLVYPPIECGRDGDEHYMESIYYFNPTANDRNLEFAPSRNLMPEPYLAPINVP